MVTLHKKTTIFNGKHLTPLPIDKIATFLADGIVKCIFLNEKDKISI